jgi:CheY-like chemotaxis protein
MSGSYVLLVDDEPAIVRALQFGLRRRGFEVLSAGNGRDALAILKSPSRIDLLLSDVIMPGGISGIELARASKTIRPELPVLLTTGYAYDLLESMGAGPDEFQIIYKPCSVASLVERIQEIIRGNTKSLSA